MPSGNLAPLIIISLWHAENGDDDDGVFYCDGEDYDHQLWTLLPYGNPAPFIISSWHSENGDDDDDYGDGDDDDGDGDGDHRYHHAHIVSPTIPSISNDEN